MTERDDLYRAILNDPLDNTIRLVMADWLEEFGTSDLDRATVEFVRVSCPDRPRKDLVMPAAAFDWLHGNWWRLIPSVPVVRRHPQTRLPTPDGRPGGVRNGRWVWFQVRGRQLGALDAEGRARFRMWSVKVSFSRGFADVCRTASAGAERVVRPYLAADQPLAVFV